MSLFQYFKTLDHRFSWSFLGFVLTLLLAIAYQVYPWLFPRKYVEYRVSFSSVFDVKEKVPALQILYNGADIRKQNQSLTVVTVRIINTSRGDILKDHYDQDDPLGIAVFNGQIIESERVGASNPYLFCHSKANLPSELSASANGVTEVSLNNVIIERGEWLAVKLLVLHPIGKKPIVVAKGKLAGILSMRVIEDPAPLPEKWVGGMIFGMTMGMMLLFFVRVFREEFREYRMRKTVKQ